MTTKVSFLMYKRAHNIEMCVRVHVCVHMPACMWAYIIKKFRVWMAVVQVCVYVST